ncbi:MAG: D-Ala-D-Ala carboxypeptidase family metallohydrolase [Halothece sp.]
MKLIAVKQTILKKQPSQSSQLSSSDMVNVSPGWEAEILSEEEAEAGHLRVVLKELIDNFSHWYVFSAHVQIYPDTPQSDESVLIGDRASGQIIKLPTGEVDLYRSIIPSGHFNWAEATKNGQRIPTDKSVVSNIIKVAGIMEEVRERFGDRPITINSWYRDPVTNRKVGGAIRSRHLVGDAVDFVVKGIPPRQVNQALESWWGDRGGLASASSFTHIDCRGFRARWSYGF